MLKKLTDDLERSDPPNLLSPDGQMLLGMKCHFVEVNTRYYSDYVGFALSYYRKRPFPLYQIVWPNTEGFYPWHPRAREAFKEWQSVLGMPLIEN